MDRAQWLIANSLYSLSPWIKSHSQALHWKAAVIKYYYNSEELLMVRRINFFIIIIFEGHGLAGIIWTIRFGFFLSRVIIFFVMLYPYFFCKNTTWRNTGQHLSTELHAWLYYIGKEDFFFFNSLFWWCLVSFISASQRYQWKHKKNILLAMRTFLFLEGIFFNRFQGWVITACVYLETCCLMQPGIFKCKSCDVFVLFLMESRRALLTFQGIQTPVNTLLQGIKLFYTHWMAFSWPRNAYFFSYQVSMDHAFTNCASFQIQSLYKAY